MSGLDGIRTHDEWGVIDPGFLARVREGLEAGEAKTLRALTRDLHAADLADVIEALDQDERVRLISALGRNFDAEALAELDEGVRDELMEALPNEVIAQAVKKLDTDDSRDLTLEEMSVRAKDDETKEKIAARFKEMDKNEDGKLCHKEFIAGMAKRKKPCDKDDEDKDDKDKDDEDKDDEDKDDEDKDDEDKDDKDKK